MEITVRNKLEVTGKGILVATKAGTRKFDKDGNMTDLGEIVEVVETGNIICNEGLLLLAGFARDESATYDTGITYCEIGTGATAPAAGDITLTTFHHRNAKTNSSRSDYEDTFSTFFTAAESTANIKEASVWGGGDAAAGEATGLLFAHWLAAFDNSGGLYDITINYVLTFARG